MRDIILNNIRRNNVLKDAPYEYPEEFWEEMEPYEPLENPPAVQAEAQGSEDDDSQLLQQGPEPISMGNAPRIFRSLFFDNPPPGNSCIQKQEYTGFITESLKEYQKTLKKTPKIAFVDKPHQMCF